MSDLGQLQARLGVMFRDEALLRLAFTHPSLAHEQGERAAHNQRLEFLGDAVLQVVLTRELYERFPAAGEGELTKLRAKLVNRRSLAELARGLELGAHLVLSRGESMHGGRERASTLADTFEAVLGAMFLDQGYEAVSAFVLRLFGVQLATDAPRPGYENPKGELQEWLQAQSAAPLEYRVERAEGPDHDRWFECAVYHRGVELGRGAGKSKKAAESQAAQVALLRLRAPVEASPPAKTGPAAAPGSGEPPVAGVADAKI